MSSWVHHGSKTAYENNWIRIREDRVTTPNGKPGIYGVIEFRHDSAYAVPVTSDHRFILAKQFRYPLGIETWEFPSGQSEEDDPIAGARREMLEETGYTSRDATHLATLSAINGLSSARVHVVLAENATQVTSELDPNDGILDVQEFTDEQVSAMITGGELICPHSISAFHIAVSALRKQI